MSRWVRPILDLYYRGTRYTDPINEKSYRKFLPYGYAEVRKNVLSPGTFSLERHRLLWIYLKQIDFFNKNYKVLHFAPEQAFYQRLKKQKKIKYITTDLVSPLADVKADITNLPFHDNEFDVIFCNHVLEHIKADVKAMEELYRIMKPGGWGIFQVPLDEKRKKTFQDDSITDPKERTKIFGQYDHVRIYGWDYFDRLKLVGFQVKRLDLTKNMTDEEIDKYRLVKGEILPVVYKS